MNFKVKNIIVEKKIVAKVFKYTKKKLKGVHFFTPNNQPILIYKEKVKIKKKIGEN